MVFSFCWLFRKNTLQLPHWKTFFRIYIILDIISSIYIIYLPFCMEAKNVVILINFHESEVSAYQMSIYPTQITFELEKISSDIYLCNPIVIAVFQRWLGLLYTVLYKKSFKLRIFTCIQHDFDQPSYFFITTHDSSFGAALKFSPFPCRIWFLHGNGPVETEGWNGFNPAPSDISSTFNQLALDFHIWIHGGIGLDREIPFTRVITGLQYPSVKRKSYFQLL